jgi:biofilm PGA synthesis N-glycosyltransferase PgaC
MLVVTLSDDICRWKEAAGVLGPQLAARRSDLQMPTRARTLISMTMLLAAPRTAPDAAPTVVDADPATGSRAFTSFLQTGKTRISTVLSNISVIRPRKVVQPTARVARILALVPAHNEQDDIARTVDALLTQTRRIDKIVVLLDNCTDDTEKIVSRYRGVTIQKTVGNIDKKVGALSQGWQTHAAGYDFVLGVDADTVVAPDAVAQLEDEMIRVPSAAGVMARYTFDMKLSSTFIGRQLIRAQRMDFASWLTDIMAKERSTYVLGGQATLFRVAHLQDVVTTHERNSPWDPDAQVEDMELTWRLHEAGRKTLVSATARAYAGPMVTVKGLLGQRRKWDEGMAALLWKNKMPDRNTLTPWKQQVNMFSNFVVRLMFLIMVAASVMVHQFVWSPIWLIPIGVSTALNLKVAWRTPDRTAGDIAYALLILPSELWMLTRMYSTMTSWINIWFGARRDGWAAQAAAERGGTGGGATGKLIGKIFGYTALLAAGTAAATWWWTTQAGTDIQERVLTTGWSVLTVLTIIMTGFSLLKLLKPTRGYKP